MKRLIKIFMSIYTIVLLINLFYTIGYNVNALTYSDMQQKANAFISNGSSSTINTSNITKEFTDLGKILTSIGAGVVVAAATYMGILYLTSGPEAQGKLKGQLIGLVVSAVVVFGAYGIWKTAVKIFNTF